MKKNESPMRILVITNLYPNQYDLNKGLFNKQLVNEISKVNEVNVVAPLPWVPRLSFLKNKYHFSLAKNVEIIDGIKVYHPRYLMIPKISSLFHGLLILAALLRVTAQIMPRFNFDVIYSLWVYPDGFASYLVARILKKKIIIGALGSDINVYTKSFLIRKLIVFCLRRCDSITTVSIALKKEIVDLGIPEGMVNVVGNGIDRILFNSLNKMFCRNRLGLQLDCEFILFIGNLVTVKGIYYLLEAFGMLSERFPDLCVIIAGDGPLKMSLKRKAVQLKLEKRIFFVGKQQHSDIPLWINASDVICLPSLMEGLPNIMLEAFACGKPVVASEVGGVPEILISEQNGMLVKPKDARGLAEALSFSLHHRWDVKKIIKMSIKQDWSQVAQKVLKVLEAA